VRIERSGGSAAELIGAPFPDSLPSAVARVFDLSRTALILGSGQREDIVDAARADAADVEVARRRSGGGAVLLAPGHSIWIDVLIPRDDPRWSDDVVHSAFWLGHAWAAALQDRGVSATVHSGGLQKTTWGRLVCFGALGPGEVIVDGRKVVGISQRRTRMGARFQCLVHESWNAAALLELLVLTPDERAQASAELAEVAAGPGVSLADLEQGFLAQLR
jgi:lipoate-protein ligase A